MAGNRKFQRFLEIVQRHTPWDEGEGTSDTLRRRGLQHAKLLADAEFLDDALVTLGIVLLQIVQQATPLADQHKQAAPRPVVFLVRLEVLRQLTNALA